MDIELDKNLEDDINKNYSIDSTVLRDINQRNRLVENARSTVSSALQNSPTLIPAPDETDSTITNLQNDLEYEYKLKEKELDSILDLLGQLDVKIDKIDEEIEKIDKSALVLVKEINDQIDRIKAAYEFRVTAGCVNDLKWVQIEPPEEYKSIYGNIVNLTSYIAAKDIEQELTTNYYGIKYYQKPLNRDYGFQIIADFQGTIGIGISSLAVLSPDTLNKIQIGAAIADSIDSPQAFGLGEFATVVGFGTTAVLGITTSILSTVSFGSTIIAVSGIGSTENIKIGDYIVNEDLFTKDSKVVGFGTTVLSITHTDTTIPADITETFIVPSILVDKVSIGFATDVFVGFGTYSTYPCVNLDLESNLNLSNKTFTVISLIKDKSIDFDYTKSPLNPVTIGILKNDVNGLGNEAVLVNNGKSSETAKWKKVLNEDEPEVGNEKAKYYEGNTSWPILNPLPYPIPEIVEYTYAKEGQVYRFDSSGFIGYTSTSPTGINTVGAKCVSYASSITAEKNALEQIKERNLGRINQLIAASNSLRNVRDRQELRAWGYLQSAAYTRKEMRKITDHLNELRSVDYNTLQT